MSKTALITGASSGIGYEFARILAESGYDLYITARRKDKLNNVKEELEKAHNVHIHVIAIDLSLPQAPEEIFNTVHNAGHALDVLINNAGFGDLGEFADCDWKKQDQMLQLNIISLTHLTRLFLDGMVECKSGKILNVASTAGFQAGPLMSVYYATKAYVISFSEAIANELKDAGVTVTTLCPGATESGFQAAAKMEQSRLVKNRKLPTSQEVARYGLTAMEHGQTLVIHGLLNKMLYFFGKYMPRKVIVKIVRMIQEERKG